MRQIQRRNAKNAYRRILRLKSTTVTDRSCNPEARILFAACKGCSAKHRQIPYIKKSLATQDLLHLAALCKFIHQLIQVAYLLR